MTRFIELNFIGTFFTSRWDPNPSCQTTLTLNTQHSKYPNPKYPNRTSPSR